MTLGDVRQLDLGHTTGRWENQQIQLRQPDSSLPSIITKYVLSKHMLLSPIS